MALYAYKCPNCGREFDRLSKIDDLSVKIAICPECGCISRRLMGNIAHFEFKGGL